MSAGAIGGILGAGLARALEGRYGKAAITLYGGLVTIGVALGLAILHLFWLPAVTAKDVVPFPVHVDQSSVHDSMLTIRAGARRFTASSRLWRPEMKDQALADAFAAGSDVTLWLQPGNGRIFGFDAGAAHVAPGPGVDRYMRGRSWFGWIWTGLLALGAVVTSHGAWLRWKARAPRAGAPGAGVPGAGVPGSAVRVAGGDEQRAFWSKVAGQYDRVVDRQIGGSTRAMVRERVERESALGELAEFGCGTGYYTRVLAGRADRVVASDLSPGMLALAQAQAGAANVTFQTEDCQRTSFPDGRFDTVFMSLVLHFTEPERALAEMRRILKPGGTLLLSNLDPQALKGLDRPRCRARVLCEGILGYRTKPPKGFGSRVVGETRLIEILRAAGFRVVSLERIRDTARSSNIPVEYVKAEKIASGPERSPR